MIRILTCIALAVAAWLAMPAPAQAAQSYDNCTGFISTLPATVTTQGTWCLDKDVTTSMTSGNAIFIATNNVTIDCNHFKIGGLAAGAGTIAYGIYAGSQLNATVRNCNIRGFYRGVVFTSGGGHLVEHNSFDGNTYISVLVTGSGSTIRDNLIIDTGGSTFSTGSAAGIYAENDVDILDNTVNGVAPTGLNASAYGINTWFNDNGSSVNGNRIRGLASTGTGAPYGIFVINSPGTVIRGNDVQGPGSSVPGGIGIYCDTGNTIARDNVVVRFAAGFGFFCSLSSNHVNTD